MEAKNKQQWSEEETQCFLALWASSEVQDKLLEKIQSEMAAAGYERSLEQLLTKQKKLKKDYRDHRRQTGSSGRTKNILYFDLLDSILGDRPVNQTTGELRSATDILLSIVDDSIVTAAANETGELCFSNAWLITQKVHFGD
uniref:Myb/SANT-like DNA-binding domain-containing protein n=1 Tax=Sphaeramia orbicularis TaxID=375764 RepID=A0A672YL60_9TELE